MLGRKLPPLPTSETLMVLCNSYVPAHTTRDTAAVVRLSCFLAVPLYFAYCFHPVVETVSRRCCYRDHASPGHCEWLHQSCLTRWAVRVCVCVKGQRMWRASVCGWSVGATGTNATWLEYQQGVKRLLCKWVRPVSQNWKVQSLSSLHLDLIVVASHKPVSSFLAPLNNH